MCSKPAVEANRSRAQNTTQWPVEHLHLKAFEKQRSRTASINFFPQTGHRLHMASALPVPGKECLPTKGTWIREICTHKPSSSRLLLHYSTLPTPPVMPMAHVLETSLGLVLLWRLHGTVNEMGLLFSSASIGVMVSFSRASEVRKPVLP